MKNLTVYVEGVNRFATLFGVAEVDVHNMNEEAAQKLFQRIDCDLSPENLCCDGELSPAKVRRKSKLLHGAARELIQMGYTPKDCYCL